MRKKVRDSDGRFDRIARGICGNCSLPAAEGDKLCSDHRAAARANNARHSAAWTQWMAEIKGRPCTDCGQRFHPDVMEFDHVTDDKSASIGRMKGFRRERVEAEIAKCELVCANCHRDRSRQRRLGRHCPSKLEATNGRL